MAIILITSTISPNGMINCNLTSSEERKRQYSKSVEFYLNNTDYDIVFCDNSNNKLESDNIEKNKRIEYICFDGNKDKLSGKGKGECEIINYAIENSEKIKILGDNDRLIVITGRVIIKNIKNLDVVSQDENGFYYYDKGKNTPITVVMFGPKVFWKDFSSNCINSINDSSPEKYFESTIVKYAKEKHPSHVHMFKFVYPLIDGISGTVNIDYNIAYNLPSENNTEIFVCGYKDFDVINNKSFLPINVNPSFKTDNMINACTHDNISFKDQTYSELIAIYWIWKNYELTKYVGLSHYRKYFSFLNKIPDMDEIFKKNDIIVSPFVMKYSLVQQYSICHNIKDLIEIGKIIFEKYGYSAFNCFSDTMNKNTLYQCNMFIMQKNDFSEYCSVLFSILFEYDKRNHTVTADDYIKYTSEHKKDYLKAFSPNDTVFYQSRFPGFLSERIFTWYVNYKFKSPYNEEMIMIEPKYLSEIS